MGGHLARTHGRRPRVVLVAVFEGVVLWGAVADLFAPCEDDEDEGEWGWRRVEGASVIALQPLVAAWKARYGLRFGEVLISVSDGIPPMGEAGKVPVSSRNQASCR
jgi:hypothetical protein